MSDSIEFSIPMGNDEDGFFGRECPNENCLGYFKIELGTGLIGEDLPCHCPYCGQTGPHDTFWTQDQLEFARSVAMRKVQEHVDDMLEDVFKPIPRRRNDFISISFDVKPGRPLPLHRYQEAQLETTVVCDSCGLRYAVYGVFAHCPDCGAHNSFVMLDSNLELASKELELAGTLDEPMSGQLVSDALENAVAAFDAFGREAFRVNAKLSSIPDRARSLSCQNLDRAKQRIQTLFSIDISDPFDEAEWTELVRAFQKRHLIAHKMGVIDEAYIATTRDPIAINGRKATLSALEVAGVIPLVRRLGKYVKTRLESTRTES